MASTMSKHPVFNKLQVEYTKRNEKNAIKLSRNENKYELR